MRQVNKLRYPRFKIIIDKNVKKNHCSCLYSKNESEALNITQITIKPTHLYAVL